jgi:hypothetical protein
MSDYGSYSPRVVSRCGGRLVFIARAWDISSFTALMLEVDQHSAQFRTLYSLFLLVYSCLA